MERRQFLTTGAALAAGTALSARSAAATPGRRPAGRLPARADIVAVLRRVADHWIGAHADPGDNQWARATFFSGLLALHRLTREPRYLAYARGWAERHAYGLHNGVTTRHADDHCAGQAYLDLYALDAAPDQAKIAAIEDSLHRMADTAAERHDDWWWDDALHMAMPPFARLGALRAGLVPRDRYRPVAARAWHAMVHTAVHPDGFLGLVQNVGDRPESSQPVTHDSTADFGVGAFLLAGTELAALGGG
ncbi:glycoside hydrolase family 88 protein [Streptomyces sp. C10]|uniref:glycoside hydrolase family 88 protein n=1 Tax=Streptomyces sp. C10 TaxID=531941 RepID=UPI00397EA2B8